MVYHRHCCINGKLKTSPTLGTQLQVWKYRYADSSVRRECILYGVAVSLQGISVPAAVAWRAEKEGLMGCDRGGHAVGEPPQANRWAEPTSIVCLPTQRLNLHPYLSMQTRVARWNPVSLDQYSKRWRSQLWVNHDLHTSAICRAFLQKRRHNAND